MGFITTRQGAESRELIQLSTVVKLLGVTDEGETDQLARLVASASSMVEQETDRVFARELVTEKLGLDDIDVGALTGEGRVSHRIMLRRTPVLMIEAMRFNGDAFDLSSVALENPEAGFLFSQGGLSATVIRYQQIEQVRTRFNDPLWEIDYSAGYVLPGFPAALHTFTGANVDITNNLFNVAGHKLVVGDTTRFSSDDTLPAGIAEDRDYFVRDVVAAVSFKIASQAGGDAVDITDIGTGTHTVDRQKTIPAALEQIVVDLVVSQFRGRLRDPAIKSERLGDHQTTYVDATPSGIPPELVGRLEQWRDIAGG